MVATTQRNAGPMTPSPPERTRESSPETISSSTSALATHRFEQGQKKSTHAPRLQEAAFSRLPSHVHRNPSLLVGDPIFDAQAAHDLMLLSRLPTQSTVAAGSPTDFGPLGLEERDRGLRLAGSMLTPAEHELELALLLSRRRASYQEMLAERAAAVERELHITRMLQREAASPGMVYHDVIARLQHENDLVHLSRLNMAPLASRSSLRGPGFNDYPAPLPAPLGTPWSLSFQDAGCDHPSRGLFAKGPSSRPLTTKPETEPPKAIMCKTISLSPKPAMPAHSHESRTCTGTSRSRKACAEEIHYSDASLMDDPTEKQLLDLRSRGSLMESFPVKLYRMLIEVDDPSIVSFFPHGRSFKIFDVHKFTTSVMKKYFHQTRLGSFKRQLNVYGFTRINEGPEAGGYYHQHLLRGRPRLAHLARRREAIPEGAPSRRHLPTPKTPNFGAMPPIRIMSTAIDEVPDKLPTSEDSQTMDSDTETDTDESR